LDDVIGRATRVEIYAYVVPSIPKGTPAAAIGAS
jgi:hypothetical protein